MASLEVIIDAALEPTKQTEFPVQTLVVLNHLAQMKMFGIRAGVEFYPMQDDNFGSRNKFLKALWNENTLDLYLDRIWDLTLCKGKTLLYLRPNDKGTYSIHFYDRDSFKEYYDQNGQLNEVVIRYSYKIRNRLDNTQQTKWLRLTITGEEIVQEYFDQVPSFDAEIKSVKSETFVNSLKFLPCVVVANNSRGPGQEGISEFDKLRSQIEKQDDDELAISDNISFFGNPILVTTRTAGEVTEMAGGPTQRYMKAHSMSSAQGWVGSNTPSTAKRPLRGLDTESAGFKLRRVIGNINERERFGFVTPDPISPDQMRQVQENREAIHFCLGGIDERGIHASATAYEMKVIYGKVSTTAMKKATAIYTYGICKLLQMAVAAEEDLFKQSLAQAMNVPMEQMSDDIVQNILNSGKPLPPGIFGLPPIGSREIAWRFTGPVFEDSPRDFLDKSIVVRNMQELGVRSLEAMKALFPEKTETEIKGMLADGYPFRYLGSVVDVTSQLMGMYQNLGALPDPFNPNMPLSANFPVNDILNRSLDTILKELNYAKPSDPVLSGEPPVYATGATNYQQYLLQSQQPAGNLLPNAGVGGNATTGIPNPNGTSNPVSSPATNVGVPAAPTPLQAAGFVPQSAEQLTQLYQRLAAGQPVEGDAQSGGKPSEFTSGLPRQDAALAIGQDVSTSNQPVFGSQLQPIPNIPADLAVGAEQPGSIWQQLFPTFADWSAARDNSANASRTRKKKRGKAK